MFPRRQNCWRQNCSSCRVSNQAAVLKTINVAAAYIDYFQGFCPFHTGLTNRFGLRVSDGQCFALVIAADDQPRPFGASYSIPLQAEALPVHLRIIVDDHLLHYPDSDLMDVLGGRKSFRDALNSHQKLQLCG